MGGITGSNHPLCILLRTYSAATIVGNTVGDQPTAPFLGGTAGANHGEMTDCHYLDWEAGGTSWGADTAFRRTAAELRSQATFVGFDFETVWIMPTDGSNDGYPVLRGASLP